MKRTVLMIAAGFVAAGLCWMAPAQAQDINFANKWAGTIARYPVYLELEGYAAAGQIDKVAARVHSMLQSPPLDTNEVAAATFVVSKYSFNQKDALKTDINYFLLYADLYYLLAQLIKNQPETQKIYLRNALIGTMTYEAFALTDNVRCATPVDWNEIKKTHLFPRLRKITQAYLAFQPLDYLSNIQWVLDYEERAVSRPANTSLCAKAEGTTAAVPLADPYAWANLRKEAQGLLRGFWTKRYQDSTKLELPATAPAP